VIVSAAPGSRTAELEQWVGGEQLVGENGFWRYAQAYRQNINTQRFSTAVIISGGGGFRMSFVGLQLFTWLCGLGQQEERRQNMVMTTFQQEYLQTAPLVVTELYTE